MTDNYINSQTNVNEFFTNESLCQTNSRKNVSYDTDDWEKVSIRLTGKILNLILITSLYCICNNIEICISLNILKTL